MMMAMDGGDGAARGGSAGLVWKGMQLNMPTQAAWFCFAICDSSFGGGDFGDPIGLNCVHWR